MNLPVPPNANAQPQMNQAVMPTMASDMFLAKMFTTFFARVSPASTSAKPACMKNTRQPAMNTQMLSRMAWVSGPSWAKTDDGRDRENRDDAAQAGDDSKRMFVAHEVLL